MVRDDLAKLRGPLRHYVVDIARFRIEKDTAQVNDKENFAILYLNNLDTKRVAEIVDKYDLNEQTLDAEVAAEIHRQQAEMDRRKAEEGRHLAAQRAAVQDALDTEEAKSPFHRKGLWLYSRQWCKTPRGMRILRK